MKETTIYDGKKMSAAELVNHLQRNGRSVTEALDEAHDVFGGYDECEHPPDAVHTDIVEEAEAGAVDYCERCGSYL